MRIIMFLLKCLVGLLATVGFFLVALVVVASLAWEEVAGLKPSAPEAPESMVLVLDLAPGIVEAKPDNPLSRASLGRVQGLRQTLDALDRAAGDSRVQGLLMRAGRGTMGLAQAQELRDAVSRFRNTGKFAVSFAETFGEGGNGTLHYFLASGATEVWLQPSGSLDLTGFSLQSPFLLEAMNRIGVEPQLAQREEYKGAMDMFNHSAMPEPVRNNLQRLVDSWLGQVAGSIAASRNIDEAAVRQAIDNAPFLAQTALDRGLADRLGYWDEVSEELLARAGADAEFFDLGDYWRATNPEDDDSEDGAVIALIQGQGPIVLAKSQNDPVFGDVAMGSDTIAEAISDAIEDDDVEAILLRVDSPGGSYVASDVIWREIVRARTEGKPVIVSMGNVAASGGYFVAAPATKIVAQPGSVTGSIGVVAGKLVFTGMWDHLDINWDGVKAGANADFWSANRPFTDEEWARFGTMLDRTYEDFTTKVAQGRNLSEDQVMKAAGGRVWTGQDALEMGLIDALGGYREALVLARNAAEIDPARSVRLETFPERQDPFEALLEGLFGEEIESPAIRGMVSGLARIVRILAPAVEVFERATQDPRQEILRAPL